MKRTILSLVIAVGQICTSSGVQQGSTKEYYGPADKFPKKIEGIKLIGNFNATRFGETDTIVLKADERKGEVFNQRFFRVENINIRSGAIFKFTKEHPLIIKGRDIALNFGMGTYKVEFPVNNTNLENNIPDLSSDIAANIPKNIDPHLSWVEKSTYDESKTINAKKQFENDIPPLGGFGKIPWGTSLEDTALAGEIDKGAIIGMDSLYHKYHFPENQSIDKKIILDNDQINAINNINGNSRNILGIYTLLPYSGSLKGISKNRIIVYGFSNNKLYMVGISPIDQQAHRIDPYIILEGMKLKYGNPCDLIKKDGDIVYIWKNDLGYAFLLLQPHVDLNNELRKLVLPTLRDKYMKNQQTLQNLGDGAIKDSIAQLNNYLPQLEEMIKNQTSSIDFSMLIYYSKQADINADSEIENFRKVFDQNQNEFKSKKQTELQTEAKISQTHYSFKLLYIFYLNTKCS